MSFEGLEGKKAVAFRREASRQPLANWVPGREEEKILVVPQEAGIGLVTARKKVGVDVDAMFRDRIGGLTRGVTVWPENSIYLKQREMIPGVVDNEMTRCQSAWTRSVSC